jgi:hypothetical protein
VTLEAVKMVNHFRSRRALQSLEGVEIIADPHRSVDDTAVDNAEAARVWAAVDSLPPSQRVAMTLKFASDMKLADIGAVIGRNALTPVADVATVRHPHMAQPERRTLFSCRRPGGLDSTLSLPHR